MKNFFANQFSVFVLSLVLAFILWLTVSGQDMSVHDLTVALELVNLPDKMALEDDGPETINIRVEANTAQFRFLENRKYFLRFDLSSVVPGINVYKVDSEDVFPKLPRGVRVARVYPEELALNVFPYVTKETPVVAEIVGELPDYLEMTGDLIIEPNVAKVTGPENRLANIDKIALTPVRLGEIRGPEASVLLLPQTAGLDNWLTVEPKQFRARANVTIKEGQKTFQLPVALSVPVWNGPPVPLILSPLTVEVKVAWTLDNPAPSAEDVNLSATLTKEELESPENLSPEIAAAAPKWVTIVSVSPARLTLTKIPRADILKKP